MHVLSLNVCGIKSKLLSLEFVNHIKSYDVISLCETKCDDADMNNIEDIMDNIGFEIIFKNRSKLSRFKSGGLLSAIKKNAVLRWKHINTGYDSLLVVKVDKECLNFDKDLIISCVYVPPSHSRYGREEHFHELSDFFVDLY